MTLSPHEINALLDDATTARFRSFVGPETKDGCWPWIGSKDKRGYGKFSLGGRKFAPSRAPRIALIISGVIWSGSRDVCHACDNPGCVNPDHLFLASHRVNMLDASAKGRLRIASKGRAGSLNNSAKLNESQVSEIRIRIAEGESLATIGRDYSVSRSAISLIKNNKKWSTEHAISQ